MRIGELAQGSGVEADTIRYYEKLGLLPPPPRQENGYREYGEQHSQRLAFIRHCRALDMSLADIKRLLDFIAQPEANCGDVDHLIDEQLERVRERLNSMRALEKQLLALRAQCGESHAVRECGILHKLVAASIDQSGASKL